MKIGETIQALERSEEESSRILSLIIEGVGNPAEFYGL